jgi:ABC-2 type transport system permease protein
MSAGRLLRLVAVSWYLHLKMLHRSMFDSVMQVVWPLFFATTALLVYRATGDRDALSYAATGAAVVTVWSAVSSNASGILQRERAFGTLELLVAAPAPFSLSIMSIVLAVTTTGGYAVAATLLWSRFVFGVHLAPAWPLPFALALVATVFSFGVLGFLLAWLLPPTWGMQAVRAAAAGQSLWADLGLWAGSTAAYAAAAVWVAATVLRSARRHATLSLT